MNLTPAETRALEALDEQALVSSLIDLIRVPSVTGTDAESDLQHRHADWLRTAGLDVDVWPLDLPALLADPDFPGLEAERTEGYGVVGTTGDGTPALVLCGHVDVVPIGDPAKWQHDPFAGWIDGRMLHGRGACDMKAGVAVNLAVVRALQRSGLRLERPLAVHSVISEEDGGLGAFATLQRGHTGDVAVIPEPTSDRLVIATAGALTFRLVVPGKAAHGSTRHDGVSALDAYVVLHRAMEELERRRNAAPDPLFVGHPVPYAISVGTLHAGDWASSVPDLLVAEGRFGVRLGEDPAAARAEFEAVIAAAAASDGWMRDNPPVVTWPGGQFGPGALAPDHGLIDEMRAAVRDVGLPDPPAVAAPYGSDLRLYAGLGGIPTLHYGPGDVRFAHAPREQVDLDEVFAAARALTLLVVRRCGAHL